jgi:hypothetical protein
MGLEMRNILLQEFLSSNYSGLRHLVASLFMPDDRLLAMLTLYYDACGKEHDDLVVVAGFLAPVSAGLQFEVEWNLVLREAGVRHFSHARIRTQGRRICLIRVITHHVRYWVGAGVLQKDYQSVDDADYKLHESFYPYPLCGLICVAAAAKWRDTHNLMDAPIEYVFEGGDEQRGQLMSIVEKRTGVTPVFRNRLKAVPIQAADFAAYEVRYSLRNILVETNEN